jgi:hypothetical protein
MTMMAWLVMGALASTALVVELVRRFTRKVPAHHAEKITSKP